MFAGGVLRSALTAALALVLWSTAGASSKVAAAADSEIQPYELEALRLVGILSGTSEPMGLLEGPRGEPYLLMVGTLIGRRWSKVVEIRDGCVHLEERERDPRGNTKVHRRQLCLESRVPVSGD